MPYGAHAKEVALSSSFVRKFVEHNWQIQQQQAAALAKQDGRSMPANAQYAHGAPFLHQKIIE